MFFMPRCCSAQRSEDWSADRLCPGWEGSTIMLGARFFILEMHKFWRIGLLIDLMNPWVCCLPLSCGLSLTSIKCFWAVSLQSPFEDTCISLWEQGGGLLMSLWQKPLSLGLCATDWKAILKSPACLLEKESWYSG